MALHSGYGEFEGNLPSAPSAATARKGGLSTDPFMVPLKGSLKGFRVVTGESMIHYPRPET